MENNTNVIIVGAGPAGLAISACLKFKDICNIVLEREHCCGSLWKQKAYDRLKLHLAKEFCQLPHKSFPSDAPVFVPKDRFIDYLDGYASSFDIHPLYHRNVHSACFDYTRQRWIVEAQNTLYGAVEIYSAKFLVVATGENSEGVIPKIPGLRNYDGVAMHSCHYKNGKKFSNKNVLVVGSGNSGMEIAYDLANWEARTSMVIHNPVHVLTKEMVYIGMKLLKFVPLNVVDNFIIILCKMRYGNLAKYGILRPKKGPFLTKRLIGRSPVIDVGTIKKIKKGKIKVMPGIEEIDGQSVKFVNGITKNFEAIVFATGYKSTVGRWLRDEGRLFNKDGMPRPKKPNHWKGKDGLYCTGFGSSGLFGISNDATMIADDISSIMKEKS